MALTLPSSNGASFLTARPENIQLNTHFNGGLTQTTATVTPTRLKNIEETFLEHSLLPPKPFQHEHMAGFVTPSVNISFFVKPTNNLNNQHQQQQLASSDKASSLDYYNSSISNSNSNDSLGYSDEYSSETSSSALENSNSYSFSNLIVDMNNSSSTSRSKKQSTVAVNNNNNSKSRGKSKSTSGNSYKSSMASTSQQTKPKKSTGGGRKPNKIDKLSPEEEQKRAKRRERNKLAAARCRKRRLDQTNTLMDKTSELESEFDTKVEQLQRMLTHMNALKRHIEEHERRHCVKKHLKLSTDFFASLDFEALTEAMKQQYDDDSMSEMPDSPNPDDDDDLPEVTATSSTTSAATSVIVSSNNAFHFGQVSSPAPAHFQMTSSLALNDGESSNQMITPPKRKRPNTLPVSSSYNPVETFTATTSNNNVLQTPSAGLFDGCFDGTGLTPLMPTLTPSELTPSTMAAFVKSLASPSMDDSEQKKLIII